MIDQANPVGDTRMGEQIVRRPRATDAVGRALRDIFTPAAVPSDMQEILAQIERPHR